MSIFISANATHLRNARILYMILMQFNSQNPHLHIIFKTRCEKFTGNLESHLKLLSVGVIDFGPENVQRLSSNNDLLLIG